ncbi:MAG TPA: hypothetical protein VHW24_20650 [Bryobacteraceae bacterium]|jgi:hypothetical protein|nr:hypothetical protein [Bryobacteraceae bacterium]
MFANLCKASFAVGLLTLAACSPSPSTPVAAKSDADAAKQTPAGPPQPVAAKEAFWKMYTPAHSWAPDLVTIGLKSGEAAGVKNADGKAAIWRAVFGSPSKRQSRTYVYAVADQPPDVLKGIKGQLPEPWGGPTNAVMPFHTGDFSVDSDAAYKTAASKASEWLKQKDNAEKPVSLSLGAAAKYEGPVWAIMFGTSKSGYLALVNATSGEVLSK